ncbi:MAG: hypothetical protein M5T61_18885 [Acidimicrobiia bacterium]|nr:hypothetical protein [Acidimicrobiia bacterium]
MTVICLMADAVGTARAPEVAELFTRLALSRSPNASTLLADPS